jgi:hypothetical protein
MASEGAGYAKTVQTLDGRELANDCEEYRLYCEAKFVLSLPDKSDKRRKAWQAVSKREYLAGVRDKRGQQAHDALRAEMVKLWKLGYRPGQI